MLLSTIQFAPGMGSSKVKNNSIKIILDSLLMKT